MKDRQLRTEALHDRIDELWRGGTMTRHAVYAMLSAHLGVAAGAMHVGKLTENQRLRIVMFLREFAIALAHNKRLHPGGVESSRAPLGTTIGERMLEKGRGR